MKIYKMAWKNENIPSLSEKQLLGIIMVNTLFAVTTPSSAEIDKIEIALVELRKRKISDIGKQIMEKIDHALFNSQPHIIWNKYSQIEKQNIRKKCVDYLRSVMIQILNQK